MRLCRLGCLGSVNKWEYAFFKYSDMKYALSLVASGSFEATPEEAFDCSAGVYLPQRVGTDSHPDKPCKINLEGP